MKRTQLYLDEETARVLATEARRAHSTVSHLVREAVAEKYGRAAVVDRNAVIDRLAGVWADRADLSDATAFVRGLRRSTRPTRWAQAARGKVSSRQRRHH